MRETEERRRLVQQHMANLKRQRALEAERGKMAKEDALALALVREEKRFVQAWARAWRVRMCFALGSLASTVLSGWVLGSRQFRRAKNIVFVNRDVCGRMRNDWRSFHMKSLICSCIFHFFEGQRHIFA